jgi:hypothetical protein
MPRNGSGSYTLPAGNPVTTGTTISSSWANSTLSDIATALTNSLAKDGQTTPTANLPMGTYKLTGLGAGSAATDSVNLAQVQNGAATLLSSVSGADTITAVANPTLTAYATGNTFRFTSVGANTGAVTINIDSLGAKDLKKFGSTALAAGDIPSGAAVEIYYDGTQFQLIGLAASSISSTATATTQSANDNSTKIATTAYSDRAGRQNVFDVDASVNANALTLTINAQYIAFRSATVTDGTPVIREVASPITLTISSGSTLGTTSGVQSEIAIIAIDNAGTVEVAAVNTSGGTSLSGFGVITTTAEGGAGAADSATAIYSTTARTDVAYEVVGYVRSTQATAGTWATTPSLVQGSINPVFNPPLTLGTSVATTSGTSVDFTGIPPGVKRVTMMFNSVSTNGTSIVLIQLGAGSAVATGYLGTSSSFGAAGIATTNYTTGFGVGSTGQTGAATVRQGSVQFNYFGGNVWTCSGQIAESNSTSGASIAGTISLGGQLDRIRLTTVNGTDAFDAGSVNILYE